MAKYFAPDDNPCVEEMTCSICLNVWMDPVEVRPCCHTYCTSCLGNLSSCPDCRADIKDKTKPNRILINLLHVLEGQCSRCGWRGTHGEYSTHHGKEDCVAKAAANPSNSPSRQASISGRPADFLAPAAVASHFEPVESFASPTGPPPPSAEEEFASFREGAGERGELAVVTDEGIPTCMLFPTLPESADNFGSNTGLEQRDGTSSMVMISTASKPWREFGLTREQYEALQLAFFAFADRVPASEAPYPEMAADDRDRENGGAISNLRQRSILLLRPEAVKRCLWWVNAPFVSHDSIVDELFPSFDIHLPLLPEKVARVNEGTLPRPLEGPLAANHTIGDVSSEMVFGVTLHQYLNWLGWNAQLLEPPLAEYGLSRAHYDAILSYARTEDADQTGAYDPDAVKRIIQKLVQIRAEGPDASPVSIRPSAVLSVMLERRNAATRDASSRPSTKLMLVGPSYPPGEFLLHDLLIACKHAEVSDDWCDISDEDIVRNPGSLSNNGQPSAPPPTAVNRPNGGGATSAANRPPQQGFHSEGQGSVSATTLNNSGSSTAAQPSASSSSAPSGATTSSGAAPPPKVGIFQKLFGKKTPAQANGATSQPPRPQQAPKPQQPARPSGASYPGAAYHQAHPVQQPQPQQSQMNTRPPPQQPQYQPQTQYQQSQQQPPRQYNMPNYGQQQNGGGYGMPTAVQQPASMYAPSNNNRPPPGFNPAYGGYQPQQQGQPLGYGQPPPVQQPHYPGQSMGGQYPNYGVDYNNYNRRY